MWSKKYYQENRERILERIHQYSQNNKEVISNRNKKHREENKEKIKARRSKTFICECGAEGLYDHKSRHLKTKQHIEFINTIGNS